MSEFRITKDDIGRKAVREDGKVFTVEEAPSGGFYYTSETGWTFHVNENGQQRSLIAPHLDLIAWHVEEPEVSVQRTWETIHFSAKSGNESASVELTMNRKTGIFKMNTAHEEGVSFAGDTIESAKLKTQCLNEAIKYMEENP